MANSDYVVRLEQEYSELKERITKLILFTEGARFTSLSFDEQYDLKDQLKIMLDYQRVLFKRLMRIYGRQEERP